MVNDNDWVKEMHVLWSGRYNILKKTTSEVSEKKLHMTTMQRRCCHP